MKTNLKLIAFATLTSVAFSTLNSCKSKKATSIQKEKGSVEITVPFSESKYRSDKQTFRSTSSGNSPDLAMAKKISLNNAKTELAGLIQLTLKKVTDQYSNQRTVGKEKNFENKVDELSREVTNQSLANFKIIGEKIFQEKDDTYTYWIAIEADKGEIFDQFSSKISSKEELKLDYDKQKFQEIFDAEMKKLEEEQP